MTPFGVLSRALSRGFTSLSLVILLVVALAVLGGLGWYASQNGLLPTSASSVSFTAAPASGAKPFTATFTVTRIKGDAYDQYVIDFGNGSTQRSSKINPASFCTGSDTTAPYYCRGTMLIGYTYLYAGTYTATLKDLSGNVRGSARVVVK